MSGWRDFVPGEVLTAANVQDYLMDQSVMVFASAAARTSGLVSPTEGMVTYLSDSNSIEIYDGSAWKRALNTTGSLLQVVHVRYETPVSKTASSYSDTGLTASITPSSTSSKILVIANHASVAKSGVNADSSVNFKLFRDATELSQVYFANYSTSTVNIISGSVTMTYLDSPNSVSSITYKTQYASNVSGQNSSINENGADSGITLFEIAG